MRVSWKDKHCVGGFAFGVLIGLLVDTDRGGDTVAVVRQDGFGLYCKTMHASKLAPTTPEIEEAFKP